MEDGVSGFKVSGDWADIVEHGERITAALEAADAEGAALDAWESWRPKADDRLDEEMSQKTAAEASISEGAGEEDDISATEDLQQAGAKLSDSYSSFQDDEYAEASDSLGESIEHAGRAADTAGRQAVRAVEERLYEDVVTSVSPYYFDNELVSANIHRPGTEFVFEVDINDDDLKDAARETLDAQNDERWRIDVEPETEFVEATTDTDLSASTD